MIFAEQIFKIDLFTNNASDYGKSGFIGFIYVADFFQLRFAGVLACLTIFENVGDFGIFIKRQRTFIALGKFVVGKISVYCGQACFQ